MMQLEQLETLRLVNGLTRIPGGAPASKKGRMYS